jgi:hypothetical protein
MAEKKDFLKPDNIIKHIDITKYNVVELINDMGDMAFQQETLTALLTFSK